MEFEIGDFTASGKQMLQWGHDRAVVELARLRYSPSRIGMLQWGHDRAVVELLNSIIPLLNHVVASMGPRPRGALQWGHDRAVVELMVP